MGDSCRFVSKGFAFVVVLASEIALAVFFSRPDDDSSPRANCTFEYPMIIFFAQYTGPFLTFVAGHSLTSFFVLDLLTDFFNIPIEGVWSDVTVPIFSLVLDHWEFVYRALEWHNFELVCGISPPSFVGHVASITSEA